MLEREPLERLAADGQLRAFRHEGFWDCMDTYKDAILLNDLWAAGADAPWARLGVSARWRLIAAALGLRHRRLRAARLLAGARRCWTRGDARRGAQARPRAARALAARGPRGALRRRRTATSTTPGSSTRALGEYEVDTVFHLAAQTIVGDRQPLAARDLRDQHRGHLDAAGGRAGCTASQRVVVAASDKAYGAARRAALPRGASRSSRATPTTSRKAATDLIARSYWHTFGLPVAVTRFANLYGGGDLNRSRLVPEAVSAALAGRAPVIRSDGSPERDFLYVEDAVAAYLAIADALRRRRRPRRGVQRRRRTRRTRCARSSS